ncbi:protein of unknown function [Taphrina deformans PYCC 5710]|uniref:Tricalbin n=1 Tax=Taphrina deformans (strain PYCC 5710 / ATCC 11124 / CBS 356.35 / IMI 108563 / JCM 9778 / NBRC 8474) TaxID=1097556 RepID=R4XGS7_TAPDE|nr:protein of unknown function [Taphrina deformans PYCC 5710]|eukprot:CCG84874.1 protein of unknown function [Taphrina deformans PYCC 5710]
MSAFSELPSQDRPTSARSNGYEFRSDATPQQKKAEALKAAPSGLKTSKRNRGEEIVGDVVGEPALSMPAPSSQGLDSHEYDMQPQAVPAQDAAIIGWEMAGGSNRADLAKMSRDEDRGVADGVLESRSPKQYSTNNSTLLEDFLPQSSFGDWYHNAGIMIFCSLSCWVIGRFGGSLAWIIIIGSICATYYRTSIRRVRRNVRDDIARQLAIAKLETDTETAEWMNSFLTKFWIIYEPVLSATIVASVDQVLATSTPASIESMRLSFFTLGTKPPRIDHVKTYPKSEDDIVLMDWRFSFTPNDTEDLTTRQVKNKINPKIELAVRAGVSVASVSIPIIVEDIAFSGLIQVRIKLITEYPHVKIVDLSFLEKPDIGYVLKPIGGSSLGFDIGFVPGLSGWILEQIHATMSPMMYAPNVFTLNIQQMMSGAPIDSAVGVAVVTIHSCHGLRNTDLGSGTPDPYVTLSLSNGEVSRTQIIKSQTDPKFDEKKTILLTTLTDALRLEVFDYNEVRKDKVLGLTTFDLKLLEEDPEREHMNQSLRSSGKTRGSINFSVSWFPVLTAPKLDDGSMGLEPVSKSGIVRFTVHQAKNLGGGKSASPFAILTKDSHEIARTTKMRHTHNPVWDFSKEILVTNRDHCTLGVQIRSDDLGADAHLGAYSIRLVDLLQNTRDEVDDFILKDSRDPASKVKLTATWKPIAMEGSLTGKTYVAPIGALRVEFIKAIELRNPELGLTGGKADPYMRVMVNGEQRTRTITIKNEQSPEWNEIVYVPIKNSRERVVLEVMDYQSHTRDRSLGQIDLDLGTIIDQDDLGAFLVYEEGELRTMPFTGKDAKGSLHFHVSFYPALSVMTPEEEQDADQQPDDQAALADDRDAQATAPLFSKSVAQSGSDLLRHNRTMSAMTGHSVATNKSKEYRAKNKIRLHKDEIMQHNSGFLVFELLEGQVAESGTYLQVLLDDYLYPTYTTQKARSKHARWSETGEGFVRELDASRITLRVSRELDSTDNDDVVASAQDETLNVLRRSYEDKITQTLKARDGSTTSITFRCRYIPVTMSLNPRESINNMGTIRVTVVSGNNLCAADRGNKSDPYAKFYLSTQKDHVYKTETIKKTLNPQWNETFEQPISSRLDNIFRVEVFDWDALDTDDFLGSAEIPLQSLTPLTQQQMEIALEGPKGGSGKSGTLTLQLLFKPDFVIRTRRGSTTRALTMAAGVGMAPVKGITTGLQQVKKTGSFVGRGIHLGRNKSSKEINPDIMVQHDGSVLLQEGNPPGPNEKNFQSHEAINYQESANNPQTPVPPTNTLHSSALIDQDAVATNGSGDFGTLRVHLLRGSGFPQTKSIVRVRSSSGHALCKTESSKQINPSFDIQCEQQINLADTLEVSLMEHSTFSSDKVLAKASISLPPMNTTDTRTVQLDTGAEIIMELKLSTGDVSSLKSHRTLHIGSPFRKSSSQREK